MSWKLQFAIRVVLVSIGAVCLLLGSIPAFLVCTVLGAVISLRYGRSLSSSLQHTMRDGAALRLLVMFVCMVGVVAFVGYIGFDHIVFHPGYALVYWAVMVWLIWRSSVPMPSSTDSA